MVSNFSVYTITIWVKKKNDIFGRLITKEKILMGFEKRRKRGMRNIEVKRKYLKSEGGACVLCQMKREKGLRKIVSGLADSYKKYFDNFFVMANETYAYKKSECKNYF